MATQAQRKAQKRAHILDVADRLFRQEGVKAVKVTDIAKAAGVSQVTIFNYFGTKLNLAHEVVVKETVDGYEEYEQLLDDPTLSFEEKAREMIRRESQTARQLHPDFVAFLVDDYQGKHGNFDSVTAYNDGRDDFWQKFLKLGRAEGQIRPEVSDAAIMAFTTMLINYIQSRPAGEEYQQPVELSSGLSEIFFHGMLKN
ncbi:TetR/AcrR family transcriptional regulator [Lacticaseibacillus brantae]|uniref:TetR/AcrR family transcriptional regulator n=1 Tax=Lacticaseibacillus brantae TaxID=943673 RepID=UPI000B03D2DF|nr:TetR/AcrR family transcriptional regulator [Lacticaseibacillus brantae]